MVRDDDGFYRIERLGIVAHERAVEAELDLLGSVLADPARLVPVATGRGVTCASFGHPDLQMIFAACLVCGPLGVVPTLRAARVGLRAIGQWDPGAHAWERRGTWSAAGLVALSMEWPAHEQAVVVNADRLVRYGRVMAAARGSYERCRRMLERAVRDSDGAWWRGGPNYGVGGGRDSE